MELKSDIAFEQIIELIKHLPKKKLIKLREKLDQESASNPNTKGLKKFLMKGPVFSKTQLEQIQINRQNINQWRSNSPY